MSMADDPRQQGDFVRQVISQPLEMPQPVASSSGVTG